MQDAVKQEKSSGKVIMSAGSKVCVEISEFKGQSRIDIRKWFKGREDGTYMRTRNGLNVSKQEWDELMEVFGKVDAFVQENIK